MSAAADVHPAKSDFCRNDPAGSGEQAAGDDDMQISLKLEFSGKRCFWVSCSS